MALSESFEADVEIRCHGEPGRPTLVYLPGIHGDWTLAASFRARAAREFQFVEMTYPRTLTWSVEDYARAVLEALERAGVERGWILAESYGSQVAWAVLERLEAEKAGLRQFDCEGLILAGGFVKYPARVLLGMARTIFRLLPWRVWKVAFWFYGKYAGFRHRRAPETASSVDEFIARRTPEDIAAMGHRLNLIAGNDPRAIARAMNKPVYLLAGLIDPIVPVVPMERWLKRNCPGFRRTRSVGGTDRGVAGSGGAAA